MAKDNNDHWADVRGRSYTKDDLADGETTRLWQDVKPLLADADALLAFKEEIDRHSKDGCVCFVCNALAALPERLRECRD